METVAVDNSKPATNGSESSKKHVINPTGSEWAICHFMLKNQVLVPGMSKVFHAHNARLFDLEREALQKEAAMKKKAWQEPGRGEMWLWRFPEMGVALN